VEDVYILFGVLKKVHNLRFQGKTARNAITLPIIAFFAKALKIDLSFFGVGMLLPYTIPN